MNQKGTINISRDPEKEIASILIDSSLYLEMSPADRQKLIRYLASSYFNFLPNGNRRALPRTMQTGLAL
jgi:hypothetical protein